jgi:hypothetical protein
MTIQGRRCYTSYDYIFRDAGDGQLRAAGGAKIWRLCPRLGLPQDPDYLFLAEPAALHLSVSF